MKSILGRKQGGPVQKPFAPQSQERNDSCASKLLLGGRKGEREGENVDGNREIFFSLLSALNLF